MEDINEMIKSVKAEEEQERSAKFDKALMRLKNKKVEGRDSKVSITLGEYLMLKAMQIDLDRILRAIIDALTLSYNNEYLTIGDRDGIVDAFRILFPEAYEKAYEAEIDKYTQENSEGE